MPIRSSVSAICSRVVKAISLKIFFIFSLWVLLPLSSLAQDYDYDEVVSTLEESVQSQQAPKILFNASSSQFQNVAYDLSGELYSAGMYMTQKNDWMIGLDVPYIVGQNTGIQTQELGNPQFKARFNAWQMTPEFSVWLPVSARFGQRGKSYVIASHHDTYRVGIDFDYAHDKVGSTVGFGYQARVLEEDPKFDVGNMIDYKMAVRYALSPRFTAQGVMQWYRIKATQIEKKEIGKDVDWASVSPGLAFHIVEGFDFTTSVVIPIIQTGTPMETDLAFSEIYYPQSSRVSIAWGIGANF